MASTTGKVELETVGDEDDRVGHRVRGRRKVCRGPFEGESSIEGVLAPSDRHAHTPMAEVPA